MKNLYRVILIYLFLLIFQSCRLFNQRTEPIATVNAKNANNLKCVRKHISSDSILSKTYPFDADSIIVFYPDRCCDDIPIGGNYEDHYHYLKKMTRNEIIQFAAQFIDYDYQSLESEITLSENIFEFNRPDIILLFYKEGKKNYLKMFFDDNTIRFESSFDDKTDLYFKEWCNDLEYRMRMFFKLYFDYTIEKCNNCDPVIILEEILKTNTQ